MTNRELFKLATMSFALMTAEEQVLVLSIFTVKVKKDEPILDSFIEASCSICKSANKVNE